MRCVCTIFPPPKTSNLPTNVVTVTPTGGSMVGSDRLNVLATGGGGGHEATVPPLGATMGQVCFTAISSNRACPTVFIALSSV